MKDYDYHSLFYYEVLARLQDYRDQNNRPIKPSKDSGEPNFTIYFGYEPRPDRGFDHHYQRNKFVAERDKLVAISKPNEAENAVVIMRVSRFEDKAVIYKKALRHIFGGNYALARRELTLLMEKFYEIEIADASGFTKADFSDRAESNNAHYVDRPLQKKANQTISFVPWG